MKKYRVGVIGLGSRSETFVSQPRQGFPRTKLAAVCDIDVTAVAHGSLFHRRFHRRSERSGGWLNAKCSHDLDPQMLGMFLDAIEGDGRSDAGLLPGLAATLVAEKALETARAGSVIAIKPEEYEVSPACCGEPPAELNPPPSGSCLTPAP